MAFEDLKDKLSDSWSATYARMQESPAFVQLQERYQALPPIGQKAALGVVAALLGLILLMLPWSWYSSASDNIALFEEQKDLISKMHKAKRDAAGLGAGSTGMDPATMTNMIQNRLSTSGKVTPDQIKSVQQYTNPQKSAGIPAAVVAQGASVSLSKLNLTQLVHVGHELQSLGGVKMIGMDVRANGEDARYFDVTYKLVSFSIPEKPKAPPAAPKGRSRSGSDDEDGDS